MTLPAVFSVDLRLNTPRFANVKSILKAKKKRVDSVSLDDLGIDISPRTELLKVELPEARAAGIIVESDLETGLAKKVTRLIDGGSLAK